MCIIIRTKVVDGVSVGYFKIDKVIQAFGILSHDKATHLTFYLVFGCSSNVPNPPNQSRKAI